MVQLLLNRDLSLSRPKKKNKFGDYPSSHFDPNIKIESVAAAEATRTLSSPQSTGELLLLYTDKVVALYKDNYGELKLCMVSNPAKVLVASRDAFVKDEAPKIGQSYRIVAKRTRCYDPNVIGIVIKAE